MYRSNDLRTMFNRKKEISMFSRRKKVFFVFLITAFIAGCNKNSIGPETTSISQDDQSILNTLVENDPLLTSDAIEFNDGSATLPKLASAINVVKWGRKIDSVQRTKAYEMLDDSTILVTLTTQWSGKLWLRVRELTGKDTTLFKNFSEETIRRIKFQKNDTARIRLNRWRLREISAVKGGTTNAQGIILQKVTLYTSDDTVEVTDPLSMYFTNVNTGLFRLRTFSPSINRPFKIQVIVRSSDPDSDLIVAHRPLVLNNSWSYRAPMELVASVNNGDGTYTRTYEHTWNGAWIGRHHVMVAAIPRNAIYDDVTPFSSQIWGIPFLVQ